MSIELFINKIICFFVGHDWGRWDRFSNKNFRSVSEQNSRSCNRCCKMEHRPWKTDQVLKIRKFHQELKKILKKGEIGQINGVRFMRTSKRDIR